MSFIVDQIKNSLHYGISRPHSYQVIMVSPSMVGLTSGAPGIFDIFFSLLGITTQPLTGNQAVSLMCVGAELPGKGFATSPQQTYGPQRKMPYAALYDDLSLTFICSGDMYERRYFDNWQSLIANPKSHYFKYYDSYVRDLYISKLSETGAHVYGVTFLEAYPVSVAAQPLAYDVTDSYQTVTVTFAYRKWLNDEDSDAPTPGSGVVPRPGTGGGLPGDLPTPNPIPARP